MPVGRLALQRIGDGQGGQRALALADGRDGAVDQGRVDERAARASWIRTRLGRMVPQRQQAEPDRCLPRRAADHGDDPLGMRACRLAEKRAVVGMDGDDDRADARMRQETSPACAR